VLLLMLLGDPSLRASSRSRPSRPGIRLLGHYAVTVTLAEAIRAPFPRYWLSGSSLTVVVGISMSENMNAARTSITVE
jgi:hypothetical protein